MIGDLGLATTTQFIEIDLDKSKQSMVGTSEFMAPEIYTQRYDEKIDVYSFGLMVLELVTKEFPYTECKHTMEIYQRVTSGVPPESLKKITIKPLHDFIMSAITQDPQQRPTAKDLLSSSFFQFHFTEEVVSIGNDLLKRTSKSTSTVVSPINQPCQAIQQSQSNNLKQISMNQFQPS